MAAQAVGFRGVDRSARHRRQEIHTQLHDGATLAEIATAQGVEVQAVVDALVGELQRPDSTKRSPTVGSIRPRPTRRLADAETRITDMVNNGRPERGGRRRRRPMGDMDTDAPADTAD